MRREISFELIKDNLKHRLKLRPVPNTPKYQILIEGKLKYMGARFTLDECLDRLSFLERSGYQVKMASRKIKDRRLARFQTAAAQSHTQISRQSVPAGGTKQIP